MRRFRQRARLLPQRLRDNPPARQVRELRHEPAVPHLGRRATSATARRRPTTRASDDPNIEIDGWGLVLWAARQYVDASGDAAWLDETTRERHGLRRAHRRRRRRRSRRNLEPNGIVIADATIWEVHGATSSTSPTRRSTAARGFCDMAGDRAAGRTSGDVDEVPGRSPKKVRDGVPRDLRRSAGRARRLARGALGQGKLPRRRGRRGVHLEHPPRLERAIPRRRRSIC